MCAHEMLSKVEKQQQPVTLVRSRLATFLSSLEEYFCRLKATHLCSSFCVTSIRAQSPTNRTSAADLCSRSGERERMAHLRKKKKGLTLLFFLP